MRVLWAAAVLLFCVWMLFPSSQGASAQGQALHAAISSGEKLVLYLDVARGGTNCTVIDVRGDFVGCRPSTENIAQTNERWYNLKLVERIDRPERRE